MNAMVVRSALLSVLVMAATGPVTAGAEPFDTTTERFHCYRIQAGDTAADVAKRLTGHRGNLSGSLFQIFDSQRQPVSRDHYDRISPGWTVCLAEGRSPVAIRTGSPATSAGSVEQPAQPAAKLQLTFSDPYVWWFASLVFAAMTSLVALNGWRKQLALAHIMQSFGGDFVREFGRPWAQYRGARQLPRARLRINSRRARVEILVAPAPGQTYPNLSDHRSNVEYDIARITSALKHDAFAGVEPYAEGEWVVLPFQIKGRVH
jgi:hypothetical protein